MQYVLNGFLFSVFICHAAKICAWNANSECLLMAQPLGLRLRGKGVGSGMDMVLGSIPLHPPKILLYEGG